MVPLPTRMVGVQTHPSSGKEAPDRRALHSVARRGRAGRVGLGFRGEVERVVDRPVRQLRRDRDGTGDAIAGLPAETGRGPAAVVEDEPHLGQDAERLGRRLDRRGGGRGHRRQLSSQPVSDATRFEIGSKVRCTDGVCGKLLSVVVDPLARAVTHIVVEPEHRWGLGRLVPLDQVASTDGRHDEVSLRCTLAEFERFDERRADRVHHLGRRRVRLRR